MSFGFPGPGNEELQDAIFFTDIVRLYIRAEMPGWGKLYKHVIGNYQTNPDWANARPRIICDKRNRFYRILDIREWADRMFYFLGRWYDLPTALMLEVVLRPGDRVMDVGANYGHFSLAAAAVVGTSGKVIAAEPNPAAFARLQLHLGLNRIGQGEAHNIGLADRSGHLTLTIPRINSGEASFAPSLHDDVVHVTCPVSTVDALAREDPVDFLKIDVEGFEVAVLRGAITVLKRDRPVVLTEIVAAHLERAGTDKADVFRCFDGLGYRPYRLGLRRVGFSQILTLEPFAQDGPDGDVLWVPEKRRHGLEDVLPKT